MDRASLVIPDGVPVAWLQRKLGVSCAGVYRGYQAVEALCSAAAGTGQPVGFFGSTESVLAALIAQLSGRHPNLSVKFCRSPPLFSSLDIKVDSDLVKEINTRNLRYLFVGLGCPKQEIWIDKYADELNCSLLGVGAAFDWLAGTTSKPPGWMEQSGLAWLYRLIQHPRKMWYRYLVYNTKFIFASAQLLIRLRLTKDAM